MNSDIIVVDENDNPIGYKRRDFIDYDDIYRVSGLWLTDRKTGDVLLAQRKLTKKNDPGKWSAAAAGTNDKGETYGQNMVKEIREELGLKDITLVKGPKQFLDDGKHRFFCQWFLAQTDKDKIEITTQEEELEGIRWLSVAELVESIERHPSNYPAYIKDFLPVLGLVQAEA
jgi:isopentenyldiphosphate isomerase